MKTIFALTTLISSVVINPVGVVAPADNVIYEKQLENIILESWYKQPLKSLGNKSYQEIDREHTYNTLRDSFGLFTFQAADKLNAWVDACGTKDSNGVFTYQPLRFAQIMWSAYLNGPETKDDINK